MASEIPDQREKIYNALCKTLSERIDEIDWASFSEEDWSRFGYMALVEGVAPLIHWTFKHEDISGIDIPTSVKAQLMAAYYNTTAQNQLMFQELEKILEALKEADIPVIVLKGAALATTVYPEIGLRPMGDLDLLIRRADIKRANNLINEINYLEVKTELTHGINDIFDHHYHLRGGPKNKYALELHWSLIAGDQDWRTPPIDWFWDSSLNWQDQENVHTLSPEGSILFSSAHLMLQHGKAQIRQIWLYDIHLMLERYRDAIDWETIEKTAAEFHWSSALNETLLKTHKLFNTAIPSTKNSNQKNGYLKQEERVINRRSRHNQTWVNRLISNLASMTWSGRIQLVMAKVFPNKEFMKWRYKPKVEWLWPLYYPYRWFRGLVSVIRTVF
jgi:hypothetical protein